MQLAWRKREIRVLIDFTLKRIRHRLGRRVQKQRIGENLRSGRGSWRLRRSRKREGAGEMVLQRLWPFLQQWIESERKVVIVVIIIVHCIWNFQRDQMRARGDREEEDWGIRESRSGSAARSTCTSQPTTSTYVSM